MKNILFSTTRQWNCGDEFILYGCINIMKKVIGEDFNPIIYNRHPDVLHSFVNSSIYGSEGLSLQDNSLKQYVDSSFIDLVVFAGTPEWSNYRCGPLYGLINKYNLPVIAIGIGLENRNDDPMVKAEIEKFLLLTVRDEELTRKICEAPAVYLPCPSIASANIEYEKTIDVVKKIALIYSGDLSRSVTWNCVSTETYIYLINLYKSLMGKYDGQYEFSIICHYVDELPHAIAEFPDTNCLYSFDAKDYFDIYAQHDLVIGCRVHGIGICASMGITGIGISHDFRGGTLNSFSAGVITMEADLETVFSMFEQTVLSAPDKNRDLLAFKNKTKNEYIELIREKIENILTLPDKSKNQRTPETQETSNHLESMILGTNNALMSSWTELESVRRELGATRGELEATRRDLESMQGELETTNTNLESTRAELQVKHEELNTSRGKLESMRGKLDGMREDLEVMQMDLATTRGELEETDKNLANILNSKSWMITKPLRVLLNLWKTNLSR